MVQIIYSCCKLDFILWKMCCVYAWLTDAPASFLCSFFVVVVVPFVCVCGGGGGLVPEAWGGGGGFQMVIAVTQGAKPLVRGEGSGKGENKGWRGVLCCMQCWLHALALCSCCR